MLTAQDIDDTLPALLMERLIMQLGSDSFDLFADEEGVSIATDEWTLRFEKNGIAWLAIDAEPDEPDQLRSAWQQVVGAPAWKVLTEVNRESGDMLAMRLDASGDHLSIDIAMTLRQR